MLLIINLPFAPLWAKLLLIPRPYLYAGIAVFCGLGVYATASSVADLLLVLAIALVGLLLRRFGYPLAPLMIGVVLGPIAETSLRNALIASDGDYGTLVGSSITITLYVALLLVVLVTAGAKVRGRLSRDT